MEEHVIFKIEVNRPEAAAEIKSLGKSVDALKKSEDALKTSIEGLSKANKELREERKKLDTATDEGRARIQQINDEIDKNNKVIKENSSNLEKQRLNVGNYTDSIDKSVPAIGAAKTALEGMLNPMTAAIAVGAALVKLYSASTQGARDLARAQDQLAYATQFAADSFGELVSDEKGMGFFQKLTTALLVYIDPTIAGLSALGAIAQERLRDLEISGAFAQAFAKDSERQAEVNRRIRDDELQSYEVRLNAVQAINRELESSRDRTVAVLQAQIIAIKESTVSYDLNREAQLRVAQLEAEIADKREEITGKLTENVMAEAAIRKQASDERIAREDEEARLYFLRLDNKLSAERYALEQRKEFEEEFYGDGGEIDKIHKDFNARIAKETANRLKKQTDDEKKAAKAQERIERDKSEALIGFTNMVTDERSAARVLLNSLFKQDAIAETAIATKNAAVNAYKALAGIPYVGPVLGALAAAAVTAYGLSQVAGIVGIPIGFAGGGLVPGYASGGLTGTKIVNSHGRPISRSNGDDRLVTVKTGEVILNQHQQARLGGDRTFARIGVPGFVTGGSTDFSGVSRQSEAANVSREIFDAISQIRPVVTVEDINVGQTRVAVVESRAQVV